MEIFQSYNPDESALHHVIDLHG
jgi:hypothetical protein